MGGRAVRPHEARPARELAAETLPGLAVEVFHAVGRGALVFIDDDYLVALLSKRHGQLTSLQFLETVEARVTDRVVFRSEFHNPLFEDLDVAQGAQRLEHASGLAPECPPVSIGIDLLHRLRDRAAAPERHAEVMNRIGVHRLLNALEQLEHTVHVP